jgi:hypothetical protein
VLHAVGIAHGHQQVARAHVDRVFGDFFVRVQAKLLRLRPMRGFALAVVEVSSDLSERLGQPRHWRDSTRVARALAPTPSGFRARDSTRGLKTLYEAVDSREDASHRNQAGSSGAIAGYCDGGCSERPLSCSEAISMRTLVGPANGVGAAANHDAK